jgi:hypothetical protein
MTGIQHVGPLRRLFIPYITIPTHASAEKVLACCR